MLKRYHSQVGLLLRLSDAVVIAAAWLVAYALRFNTSLIEVTRGVPGFSTALSLLPLVVVLWDIVFGASGLYRSSRLLRRTEEVWVLVKAHLIALILFMALTYLITEYRYSRATLGIFAVVAGIGLVAVRLALRNLVRSLRGRGWGISRALLVGDGPTADFLLERLKKYPELGLSFVGRLSADGASSVAMSSVRVLGNYSRLQQVLNSDPIDEIWFALPRSATSELDGLLKQVRDETIDLRIIPDLQEYVRLGCAIEDFDGMPVVGVNESPLDGWGAVFKRCTDFILSGLALLILSPVLVAVAIAVRLTSPGPVFFRQERMGLDGRVFNMLKFRSMPVDAEAKTGPVWATAGDTRKTKIGGFLRSTSLDELPQLWNVLTGDMSLVGPRPERPFFVNKFRTEIPGYMLRHKVKAGITGWAQVHGWRGDTSLERRIECDLYYIRHWSYGMDWKILWLTIWRGFIHKNAY